MQSFSLGTYQVDVYRRAYQRTVTLRVPERGRLKVNCGIRVPLEDIVRFIHEKMDFVQKCEQALDRHAERIPVKLFQTGEKCPFLGQERLLEVREVFGLKKSRVELAAEKMLVFVGDSEISSVQGAIAKFYKKSAVNYLSHLLEVRSRQMDLFPSRVSFRSQRTRWGSCSSRGSISLNWRLVAGSHSVMDYVVVHELAHLKHHDHSHRFWSLVEEHCPAYRDQKAWLRENHYLFDFL